MSPLSFMEQPRRAPGIERCSVIQTTDVCDYIGLIAENIICKIDLERLSWFVQMFNVPLHENEFSGSSVYFLYTYLLIVYLPYKNVLGIPQRHLKRILAKTLKRNVYSPWRSYSPTFTNKKSSRRHMVCATIRVTKAKKMFSYFLFNICVKTIV